MGLGWVCVWLGLGFGCFRVWLWVILRVWLFGGWSGSGGLGFGARVGFVGAGDC